MPKKAPDDNDRRRAQGARFNPLSETMPYQPAEPIARPADESSLPAAPIVFPHRGWVKLHREPPPPLAASWKLLTWQARGLYRLLLTECDSDGVIPLGKVGLRGSAGLVSGPWNEIKPFLNELIENEWLISAEPDPFLSVAWFRESQTTAKSDGARRTYDYRQRRREQK